MDSLSALTVSWNFGFSKDIIGGVHNLTSKDRNALFYVSSHFGVIYDYEHRRQTMLQGHCNIISCCAVSNDKRWIVTGDTGDDCILVVWDSYSGSPVKTIFSPHECGIIDLDISDDSLFLVTLSALDSSGSQELAIWAWTNESDKPVIRKHRIADECQYRVRFDPSNQSEFVTTGNKRVSFWSWQEISLEGYVGKVSKSDFGHFSGNMTSSIFLDNTGNVVTATSDGFTILWETQFSNILLDKDTKSSIRTASKVVRLVDCGISTMSTVNGYIAVACNDGSVRFFDFFLRLEAWFEDLCAGPVSSISFSLQDNPYADSLTTVPFWVPDFTVSTCIHGHLGTTIFLLICIYTI